MRAFLLLLLSLLAPSARAEKTIVNPAWTARNTPVVTVDSILLRDTVSRLYITLRQLPHTSMTLHDDWTIQDSTAHFSGKIRDIDGVDLNRTFQFESDSTIGVEMDFPAIPTSLTEIDVIGNKGKDEIRIIGLSLIRTRERATGNCISPNRVSARPKLPDITFEPDTAVIRGKFSGFHPRLNIPAGKIILNDIFTRQQTELTVPIEPDGSFSIKMPTSHPVQQKLWFNDRFIHFYIEPSDTLYIELPIDELFAPFRYRGEIEQHCLHLTYQGKNALINDQLRQIRMQEIAEPEEWIEALNSLPPHEYYANEENKFKEKLEYLNREYRHKKLSQTAYKLSILNSYYKFLYHLFVYKDIKDKNILSEYKNSTNKNIVFANNLYLNDPLSTATEYYIPFLFSIESWERMTTPENWQFPDFKKALEKRNVILSPSEEEALKFVWGENKTAPPYVEQTIQNFNKKYEIEQISMREEKLRTLRNDTYQTYFGSADHFTRQFIDTRMVIKLIGSLNRKLSDAEVKEFTSTITNERLVQAIVQENSNQQPESRQVQAGNARKNENKNVTLRP